MAKATEENEKDSLKAWLLGLEKHIGSPVAVTLLVEDGRIRYYACVDKKAYLNGDLDDGDDEPGINLNEKCKEIKKYSLLDNDEPDDYAPIEPGDYPDYIQ